MHLRAWQVRTLNRVAMTHPMAVTNCNIDMESLISDANRSIATLAITTLLKTGAQADRALVGVTTSLSSRTSQLKRTHAAVHTRRPFWPSSGDGLPL